MQPPALTSSARAAHPGPPVLAMPAGPAPVRESGTQEDTRAQEGHAPGWTTVVWNDPVNLMSYVTYVFRSYFGYPTEVAERLMREVHTQGRATVSRGNREQMETDVQAMHGFGLWATVQAVEA